MSYIIGRGRYARETYPQRGGRGGIVQCGYDQVVGIEDEVFVPPATAFFPRDLSGAPLRVTLPNVSPGNFLEVDFRSCMEKDSAYYSDQAEFTSVAVVRFDGAPPDPPPSPDTFAIVDGSTGHRDIAETEAADPQPVFNVTNLSGVVIPPGATTAIVQILFEATSGFIIEPSPEEGTFATLKVCEMAAGAIYQPGPGTLIPLDE